LLSTAQILQNFLQENGFSVFICDTIETSTNCRNSAVKAYIVLINERWCISYESQLEFILTLRNNLVNESPIFVPVFFEDIKVYEKYPIVNSFLCNMNGIGVPGGNITPDFFQKIMEVFSAFHVVPSGVGLKFNKKEEELAPTATPEIDSAYVEKSDTSIYHSHDEKSSEQAVNYSKTAKCLCRYLSYRDIPSLITKYVRGKNGLDYGAGTGISTQFLYEQGLDVIGVDVSNEMLVQARNHCPETTFYMIENGTIPLDSETFDLVFSSFVLLELGNEKDMLTYLKEANRMLKKRWSTDSINGEPRNVF